MHTYLQLCQPGVMYLLLAHSDHEVALVIIHTHTNTQTHTHTYLRLCEPGVIFFLLTHSGHEMALVVMCREKFTFVWQRKDLLMDRLIQPRCAALLKICTPTPPGYVYVYVYFADAQTHTA